MSRGVVVVAWIRRSSWVGSLYDLCSHAKHYEIEGLLATRQSTYRAIARTYGVEQSEVISTLDTLATKKRKA
jgi:hypothetical protein